MGIGGEPKGYRVPLEMPNNQCGKDIATINGQYMIKKAVPTCTQLTHTLTHTLSCLIGAEIDTSAIIYA